MANISKFFEWLALVMLCVLFFLAGLKLGEYKEEKAQQVAVSAVDAEGNYPTYQQCKAIISSYERLKDDKKRKEGDL